MLSSLLCGSSANSADLGSGVTSYCRTAYTVGISNSGSHWRSCPMAASQMMWYTWYPQILYSLSMLGSSHPRSQREVAQEVLLNSTYTIRGMEWNFCGSLTSTKCNLQISFVIHDREATMKICLPSVSPFFGYQCLLAAMATEDKVTTGWWYTFTKQLVIPEQRCSVCITAAQTDRLTHFKQRHYQQDS